MHAQHTLKTWTKILKLHIQHLCRIICIVIYSLVSDEKSVLKQIKDVLFSEVLRKNLMKTFIIVNILWIQIVFSLQAAYLLALT